MDGPLFSKHVNLAIHGPVRHVIHNLFHKISVERCAMEEEYSFLIEEAKKSFALPFKDVFVSQIGRTHPLVFTI